MYCSRGNFALVTFALFKIFASPTAIFFKKNINNVCRYKKHLYICNVKNDKTDRPGCRNKKNEL